MGLVTRQIGPNAKGSKLTFAEMDNNLYYLQGLGVSAVTFSSSTLTLTNPTGGTLSVNLAADTNTFITAATYNQSTNTVTLTDNTNTNFNAYINAVSGLTVNGILSATTISGGTLYGDGSNLSGVVPNLKKFSRLLYIDSTYGNDSTAIVNDITKPFLTYSAASSSAVTQDLIVFRPGNYNEQIILKDGVSIFGYPGVTVTGTFVNGLVSDNSVAINSEIYGDIDFIGLNTVDVIRLINTGTTLYLECQDIVSSGTSFGRCIYSSTNRELTVSARNISGVTPACESIRIQSSLSGNTHNISCQNVIGRSVAVLLNSFSSLNLTVFDTMKLVDPSSGNQPVIINNSSSNVYIRANKITSPNYLAILTDNVNANSNFYVDADLIESTNTTFQSPNNIYRALIANYGESANTFIKAKNMIADGGSVYLSIFGSSRKTVLEGSMYSRQNVVIRNSSTRKLILKNSIIKRGGGQDNNTVIGLGSYIVGGIFGGVYNGLQTELTNCKIVKEQTLSGTSTNPIVGLDGTTSNTYSKNCEIYGENIFSGATAMNASSAANGNVYTINTYSNIDNSTNITDTAIISGFIYDPNFKTIE